MIVYLNGSFVPEEQAVVSVFDRSFLLGDGLYETLHARNGRLFRWEQHWKRFVFGANFLKIKIPETELTLRQAAGELIARNQLPHCMVRMTLSRGVGVRGYSTRGANQPSLVISCHPPPAADPRKPALWRLIVASPRLPANDPLARFKSCSKLPQILARMEADAAGADEALLLNTDGFVAEATGSNLFWIDGDTVFTPALEAGILPGVTREAVFEICQGLRLPCREANITPAELRAAQGIFLSLSSFGIAECVSLDGHPLRQAFQVEAIRGAYEELFQRETNSAAP
jgi:branched-subunit amino acid aminotransferase/4-amino-4-deoxychorismate lyase